MKQAELFSWPAPAPAAASDPQLALSLMQPWPWAVLEAGKCLENRSQKDGGLPLVCRHRGLLWLHASKSEPKWYWEESIKDMLDAGLIRLPKKEQDRLLSLELEELMGEGHSPPIRRYLRQDVTELPARAAVPRGCIVGRCVVVGHVAPQRYPSTARNGAPRVEMFKYFGDRKEGIKPSHVREVSSPEWLRRQTLWWGRGYALILADVHKLRTPVPCKGSQGLWRVQPETAAQLEGAELIPCAPRR